MSALGGELSSFPTNDQSQNVIDLGELLVDDNGFHTPTTLADLSSRLAVDLETLELFSRLDTSTKALLNPDINSNGVFDQEEDFPWGLHALFHSDYSREYSAAEFISSELSADLEQMSGSIIHFGFSNYGVELLGEATSVTISIDSGSGFEVMDVINSSETESGRWSGIYYPEEDLPTFCLQFGLSEGSTGDYLFEFDNEFTLTIQNVDLFNPFATEWALVVPFFQTIENDEYLLTRIDYQWYCYDGQTLHELDDEMFQVMVPNGPNLTITYDSAAEDWGWFGSAIVSAQGSFELPEPKPYEGIGIEYNDIAINIIQVGCTY